MIITAAQLRDKVEAAGYPRPYCLDRDYWVPTWKWLSDCGKWCFDQLERLGSEAWTHNRTNDCDDQAVGYYWLAHRFFGTHPHGDADAPAIGFMVLAQLGTLRSHMINIALIEDEVWALEPGDTHRRKMDERDMGRVHPAWI